MDPATTGLSKVFITADEHHLLSFTIASDRIPALPEQRDIYPRDAFVAIDRDRDGLLNGDDRKRGTGRLGLQLDPSLIAGFMKELGKDQNGFINLEEFKGAVGFEDDGTMAQNMAAFNGGIPLPPIPSDDFEKQKVVIPEPVLRSIKVEVRKVATFVDWSLISWAIRICSSPLFVFLILRTRLSSFIALMRGKLSVWLIRWIWLTLGL